MIGSLEIGFIFLKSKNLLFYPPYIQQSSSQRTKRYFLIYIWICESIQKSVATFLIFCFTFLSEFIIKGRHKQKEK